METRLVITEALDLLKLNLLCFSSFVSSFGLEKRQNFGNGSLAGRFQAERMWSVKQGQLDIDRPAKFRLGSPGHRATWLYERGGTVPFV